MCQRAMSVTFHVNNFALVLVLFVLFQVFWTSTISPNGGRILSQSGLPHGEGYLGDEDLVIEGAMYRIKLT